MANSPVGSMKVRGFVEGVGVAMLAAGLAGVAQDAVLLQEAPGCRLVGSGPQEEVTAGFGVFAEGLMADAKKKRLCIEALR